MIKKSLTFYIGLSLVFGVMAGMWLGEQALPLGIFGTFYIKILRIIAGPLIFFAISDSFYSTPIKLRDGARLLLLSTFNAIVALCIALTVTVFFDFKTSLTNADIFRTLEAPRSQFTNPSFAFLELLSPSIFYFIFAGLAAGLLARGKVFSPGSFFKEGLEIINKVLHGFVRFLPLAIFAVVSRLVGGGGLSFLPTLGFFVFVVLLGMFVHVFIYYTLLITFVVKKNPVVFFRQSGSALLTALGTGSSLATLPVTLETLQGKMKISPASSRLSACVGTNLNHDGIILYEATAAIFISQLQNIQLGWTQKISLAISSVLAAVGIAGIPEAGLMTLSVVLTAVGLPVSAVSVLLPVDWLLGRFRAMVNVSSDLMVANLLEKGR